MGNFAKNFSYPLALNTHHLMALTLLCVYHIMHLQLGWGGDHLYFRLDIILVKGL